MAMRAIERGRTDADVGVLSAIEHEDAKGYWALNAKTLFDFGWRQLQILGHLKGRIQRRSAVRQ
jgi:hypothetical protein